MKMDPIMLLLDLALTICIYLFVPILLLIMQKKYSRKVLKRIVIINGICGYIIFMVLFAIIGSSDIPNVPAAFFWSYIGYAILKRRCITDNDYYKEDVPNHITNSNNAPTVHARFCKNCGIKLIPNTKFCTNCGAKIM